MANTIYDVAKLAGVSIATVSRVINNTGNVLPKTEEKVKRAMTQLEFNPNSLAQSFAKKKNKTLGLYISMGDKVLMDELGESIYFTELLRGINSIVQKLGYSLLILNSQEKFENIIAEFLEQKRIDGLIIGMEPRDTKFFRKLISSEKPIVYIGKLDNFNKGLHVYGQYSQYIHNAIEYLEKENHEHIACVSLKTQKEQERLFKDKTNLKIDYHYINIEFEQVKQKIRHSFSRENRPTALYYENLTNIQPIISILNELNLSVPDDVSIISVEHKLGLGTNYFPMLTNIYVPVYEMGKKAAEILTSYVEGEIENYNQQFNIKSSIIKRDSVAKRI